MSKSKFCQMLQEAGFTCHDSGARLITVTKCPERMMLSFVQNMGDIRRIAKYLHETAIVKWVYDAEQSFNDMLRLEIEHGDKP